MHKCRISRRRLCLWPSDEHLMNGTTFDSPNLTFDAWTKPLSFPFFQLFTVKLITVSTYFWTLQIAANITSNFLKALKEDQTGTNEINVLLATQELESFAISYGRIHYKANESTVISQEHYGETLVNLAILLSFYTWQNVPIEFQTLCNFTFINFVTMNHFSLLSVWFFFFNSTISGSFQIS